MTKKSSVDVLLEILEQVPDASTAEVLLEPAHLLVILGQCGQSEDDIRTKLADKTTPGELLLELFAEGRTSDELIVMLPEHLRTMPDKPAARPKREPKASKAERAPRTANDVLTGPMSLLNKTGGVLVLVVAVAPALLISGIFDGIPIGDQTVWLLVAGFGGAAAGAMFAAGRTPLWAGVLCGAGAALGGLLLTQFWITQRTSLFRIEIGLAALIGMLPGILLYARLSRRRLDRS